MNKQKAKIIAYVVLVILAIWLGYGFISRVKQADNRAPNAETATSNQRGSTGWIGYFAGWIAVMLGLGLMVAYDLSQAMGGQIQKFILDEDAPVEKDPEYEEAERIWANGQHLEAIQHMRDFLKARPHAQYAALRIAEIYEKDLGNYVAAALEYEEILKRRLAPERWGWAAIHLANLYSGKLNKPARAEELLRRITLEHPQTAAARKARERLGEPEPTPAELIAATNEAGATSEDSGSAKAATTTAASNLPPGFRPK